MPKYLVIVESPTKEKTISKFLGKDYVVRSSYGHIRDLPKSKLGVNTEKDFEPQYVITPKAKKLIPELKRLRDESKTIYLATDFDREGEAIAWHLQQALALKDEQVKRITFHEITQEAIKDAITHPRSIDPNMVNSQQARRILDRLVGYKLSPLLWRKVKSGLSAGRVQSVAVRLICDREEDINGFKSVEYWSIKAELEKNEKSAKKHIAFLASLSARDGKKIDKLDVKDKASAEAIVKGLQGARYQVASIEAKERRRVPFAPYTTSTMQQDASRRLHFSSAKTMMVAQKLYEGVEVGSEGTVGLITYMRTDSVSIAEPARKEARLYIEKTFGKNFLPLKPRAYKTKTKNAQEAHEAIRPTLTARSPAQMKQYLAADEFRLYDLIWRRFVASQMEDALYDTVSVDISAGDYTFRAAGRTLKFSGFLEVYSVANDNDEDNAEQEGALPPLSAKEMLNLVQLLPEQHFTEPPPRYNEASLIKALEENGIGRPSTYAPIIHTILGRSYVRLQERRFYTTTLGALVNDILKKHFPEIVDLKFTAQVEDKLDSIAEGKADWPAVIKDFYEPFSKEIKDAEVNLIRQKVEPEKTDEVCPKCGKPMVIRESFRGRFLACSGFPACRTTYSLDKNNQKIIRPAPEKTDQTCEKCGSPMLKRAGKRGPFLACSGFPKCRNIKKLPKQDPEEPHQ